MPTKLWSPVRYKYKLADGLIQAATRAGNWTVRDGCSLEPAVEAALTADADRVVAYLAG